MNLSRTGRIAVVIAAIAAVVIVIRALLPYGVASYLNARLADMGDYRGQLADVDLAVLRGAYTVNDLTVVKRGGNAEQPFLAMPHLDISLEWSALFEGELVGEIQMQSPVLNLVQGETDEETQVGAGVDWTEQVRKLFPFRFNRVEVLGGTATFRAPGIEAGESLTVHDIHALFANLTNAENRSDKTFADFDVNGLFGKDTAIAATGHADPLAEHATFDVDFSLEGAPLVDVNPWLENFLNVDAEAGTFSMYAELAAADGRFEGYIKPLLEDPDIFRLDEPSDNPLQKAWEALVGFVGEVLENKGEEQVATQIPFSGDVDNPEAGILAAAVNLLRNAFVAAFTHSLEGTVDLGDLQEGQRN